MDTINSALINKTNGFTLDFETNSSYSLTAKIYNSAGPSNEVNVTINVNDSVIAGE